MPRWPEQTAEERFFAKVEKGDKCWRWLGARVNEAGHGVCWAGNGRRVLAHRFAYELLVGPIPEGLHLHHECEHPWCVNPEHLSPHTPGMHNFVHRGEACRVGHPFDEANTHIDKRGNRHCRACDARRHREARLLR